MYIYILHSRLFDGQTKKVILSWPANALLVETLANADNHYSDDNKWKVIEYNGSIPVKTKESGYDEIIQSIVRY